MGTHWKNYKYIHITTKPIEEKHRILQNNWLIQKSQNTAKQYRSCTEEIVWNT